MKKEKKRLRVTRQCYDPLVCPALSLPHLHTLLIRSCSRDVISMLRVFTVAHRHLHHIINLVDR